MTSGFSTTTKLAEELSEGDYIWMATRRAVARVEAVEATPYGLTVYTVSTAGYHPVFDYQPGQIVEVYNGGFSGRDAGPYW